MCRGRETTATFYRFYNILIFNFILVFNFLFLTPFWSILFEFVSDFFSTLCTNYTIPLADSKCIARIN